MCEVNMCLLWFVISQVDVASIYFYSSSAELTSCISGSALEVIVSLINRDLFYFNLFTLVGLQWTQLKAGITAMML